MSTLIIFITLGILASSTVTLVIMAAVMLSSQVSQREIVMEAVIVEPVIVEQERIPSRA
jgi:hypothetical protein